MITLLEAFHWSQLLQPQFYIEHGGLWLLLLVVFAETGLFAGFFLPGDSLLFVAGIYCAPLAAEIYASDNQWINLFILFILNPWNEFQFCKICRSYGTLLFKTKSIAFGKISYSI